MFRILAPILMLTLAGCAGTVDRLALRLGLVPPLPDQGVDRDAAAGMRGHFDTGAAALARNDLEGAVAAWRLYLARAPFETPETRTVRGYITLLERELARRYASQAVADEKSRAPAPGDRLRIALMPFENRTAGAGGSMPFNRAIVAMVTSDLAQVPGIQLLERQRINALVGELRLSESGLVDPATALRSGRLLGAGTVIVGSVYSGAPPDKVYTGEGEYTLGVTLTDVDRGNLLGIQEAYGQQRDFLELEKRIVHGILDILGVTNVPAGVDRVHTRSWDAYAQFTIGLKFLAEDRFEEARQSFERALRFDPNFALAEEFHLATPERPLTVEQIQREIKTFKAGA